MGRKKAPFYRIVAADSRAPRDGRFIEEVGYYNPLTEPQTIEVKEDRALYWLSQGAKPSDTVKSLLSRKGLVLRYDLMRQGLPEEKIEEEMKKWALLQDQRVQRAEAEKSAAARKAAEDAAKAEAEAAKAEAEAKAAEEAEKAKAEAEAKAAEDAAKAEAEAPAEETPAEDAKAEAPAEKAEAPAEEAPADDAKAEAPAEKAEAPAEEAPADDAKAEAPAEDAEKADDADEDKKK